MICARAWKSVTLYVVALKLLIPLLLHTETDTHGTQYHVVRLLCTDPNPFPRWICLCDAASR